MVSSGKYRSVKSALVAARKVLQDMRATIDTVL